MFEKNKLPERTAVVTEAQEHATLADLLELVSGKQYLERHVSVTTSKDEHAPAHTGTLGQPLLTFYAYGDRFVKFVVTPEAPPVISVL